MTELNEKDAKLLANIETHYKATGFTLSNAAAAEAMGMSKGSVIADMLKRLEVAGAIEYEVNRRYYVLTNWRELAAGSTPDPNATVEFEAVTARVAELEERLAKAVEDADKLRKKLAKPKTPAANPELEKLRAANRARQAAFKQRKREAKTKGV